MNKPPPSPDDEFEFDPRRRLGISTSSGEDDPAATRRKARRDRIAIAGAIVALLFFIFMLFTDAVMNFQCRPWEFVTFQCNRFDADFKPWE